MKPILGAAVVVAGIGLLAAGPFALVLVIMIAPLVVLALVSGWAVTNGSGAAHNRKRQPAVRSRHVVNR